MKTRDEALARVNGLFNITVTPFKKDGSFDEPALRENIARVLGLGYDGLLIGGTYGEFPAMSAEERAGLFRLVMDEVGDKAPVLLCTAHSDVRVVRELTKLASDLGGLPMVTTPYVSEVEDAHICEFFRAIAPDSRTGIMIYNAPGIGITLSPALIERLAEIEGVVAIKQGDLSPAVVDRLASTIVGRIRVLGASDLVFPGYVVAGFDGLSSTNSCALPEVILETWRQLQTGDARAAGALHRSWYAMRALCRHFGQPQTTKAAMNARGWKGGHVRQPLLDVTEDQAREIARVVATIPTANFSNALRRAS
jgi:dihydrodipicolinate synthase/N-acetylneuraminate lyase